MSIDPVAASAATQAGGLTGGSQTNADPLGREAFLNLLVTQLQNQDPTQPTENEAFIAQLATFSSLEQLQQMNQTLEEIAEVFRSLEPVVVGPETNS